MPSKGGSTKIGRQFLQGLAQGKTGPSGRQRTSPFHSWVWGEGAYNSQRHKEPPTSPFKIIAESLPNCSHQQDEAHWALCTYRVPAHSYYRYREEQEENTMLLLCFPKYQRIQGKLKSRLSREQDSRLAPHLMSAWLHCAHTKTVSRWASGAAVENTRNSRSAENCIAFHQHIP